MRTILIILFLFQSYLVFAQEHLNDSILSLEKINTTGIVEYVFKQIKDSEKIILEEVKIKINTEEFEFFDNSIFNYLIIKENKHLVKNLPNYSSFMHHWSLIDSKKMVADSNFMYKTLNIGGFVYYISSQYYKDLNSERIIATFKLNFDGFIYRGINNNYVVIDKPLKYSKISRSKLKKMGLKKIHLTVLKEFYIE